MKFHLAFITFIALLVPQWAFAYGPSRQQFEQSIMIDAPASEVWAIIEQFDQIHQWHPSVQATQLTSPQERIVTLNSPTAATITEKLVKLDPKTVTLTYKIIDMSITGTATFNDTVITYTALPVSNYKSSLFVTAVNKKTKVSWRAIFYRAHMANPPIPDGQSNQDAIDAVSDYYTSGLKGLKTLAEQEISNTVPTN
jgi:mxaD protein